MLALGVVFSSLTAASAHTVMSTPEAHRSVADMIDA